jgi:lipooligosaccharide transport system permease protein
MENSRFQLQQVFRVWNRSFLIFKRTWLISLCWILVEPLMYLGAVGFGLGSFVSTIGGFSYADWYFPGLICTSTMMVSFFESTYGNFTKLTYSKVYSTQMLTPISINELIIGDIMWGATKGFFSALGILFVGFFFGLGLSGWSLLVLPVAFLTGWIFSAFGMIVTSWAKNYDQIVYPTSGIIVPMSLFSGTFFPLDDLNYYFQGLAHLLPLTHAVNLARPLILKTFSFEHGFYFLTLLAFAVVSTFYALKRMQKRMVI